MEKKRIMGVSVIVSSVAGMAAGVGASVGGLGDWQSIAINIGVAVGLFLLGTFGRVLIYFLVKKGLLPKEWAHILLGKLKDLEDDGKLNDSAKEDETDKKVVDEAKHKEDKKDEKN